MHNKLCLFFLFSYFSLYWQEKGLYYDPKSGTYFYYNKSTCKYEFHSQVDLSYYTPATHDHPDRSHGSHRHSYSDKYPARSPDHSESSSGKKKKKKESRRRSSDEKVCFIFNVHVVIVICWYCGFCCHIIEHNKSRVLYQLIYVSTALFNSMSPSCLKSSFQIYVSKLC